jgi:serine/threonine-protein kinase
MELEIGLFERGIASMERALSLDPLVEAPVYDLCRAWALQGDFARAKRFLTDNPPQRGAASRAAMITRFALWSRSPPEWVAMLPPLHTTDPNSPLNAAIAALSVIDTRRVLPEFEARLRELGSHPERAARFRALLNQIAAEFHAFVGDVDETLDFVEAAAGNGLIDLAWLDLCKLFDFVRAEPRFIAARAIVVGRADEIRAALGA